MRIRVLCVLSNLRNNNGTANCMMNYYDAMKEHNILVDFLCLEHIASPFLQKIRKNGSKYYVLPERNFKAVKKNTEYINSVLTSDRYDEVHVNIVYGIASAVLRIAKKNGIGVRIIHAHNPRETTDIKNTVRFYRFNERTNHWATHFLACSESAGKSLFGKRKFTVLKNAVDVKKFEFNGAIREEYRKNLHIENKFVLGTSCRQEQQKNPFFIIDVFEQLRKRTDNAVLLWAGYGSLMEKVRAYAEKKGIADELIMTGNIDYMNNLYSAMDMFILPSRYEGLGMVLIEAQCSGLYCLASDRVPRDTCVTDRIEYISLKKDAAYWAERIIKNTAERTAGNIESVSEKGYDLNTEKNSLAEFYIRAKGH